MASRELGGGALLDESHFIDVILWLLGMPESVMGRVEHISTLEITTDDNVDMLLQYSNGVRATIHLDLFGRPHRKSITIVGEDGSIECLFDPHIVRECPAGAAERTTVFSCERNDMFLDEAREYLEVIAGRRTARCSLKDGIAVLRIVEAVRLSSARGRIVSLDEIRA
jgi:predicted dehydrogenase